MFFLGVRQNGGMVPLLSVPLTDKQMVSGQWAVLRQRYMAIGLSILVLFWLPLPNWRPYPDMESITGASNEWVAQIAVRGYISLRCVMLWLGAGWAGMYFALHSKNLQFARFNTLIFGALTPWMVFCLPEPFITIVVLAVFQSGLVGNVRSTILKKLESGEFK